MRRPPVMPRSRKVIPVRTPRKPSGLTNFLGNVNFIPKKTVRSKPSTMYVQSFSIMFGGGGGGFGAEVGADGGRGAMGAPGLGAVGSELVVCMEPGLGGGGRRE